MPLFETFQESQLSRSRSRCRMSERLSGSVRSLRAWPPSAGGVKCRGVLGGVLTLLGAFLIHRGVTGRCEGYRRLGIDTAGNSDGRGVPQDVGVKVDKSVDVRRSPMELYHFWHQLTNLARESCPMSFP